MNKKEDVPNCKQCICYAACIPVVKEHKSVGSLMKKCEIMKTFITYIKHGNVDKFPDAYLPSINAARAMFKLRDLTPNEIV